MIHKTLIIKIIKQIMQILASIIADDDQPVALLRTLDDETRIPADCYAMFLLFHCNGIVHTSLSAQT